MDPSFREEAAASGTVTVIVNTNSDVCTIRKTSGVGIPIAQACAVFRHPSYCAYLCFDHELCHMLRCSDGHAGSRDDIRVSSTGAFSQVQRLTHLASSRAGEVMQELREVLRQHEASRVSMRVRRRHVAAPQEPGYASRSVTTLPSGDVAGAQPLPTHVRSVMTASSGGVSIFHALLERNAVLHASCPPWCRGGAALCGTR